MHARETLPHFTRLNQIVKPRLFEAYKLERENLESVAYTTNVWLSRWTGATAVGMGSKGIDTFTISS